MDVFNLQAKIALDVKEYMSSLGKASTESNKFGLDIKGAFSSAMKVGAAAIGAVVSETTALSAALVKGVGDLAEYGDHIDKQSQKMNMSAQAYQEWDAIMQHSGTSIDSMQMSMKTLANAAESGNDAFGLLGMSLEDIQRMSSEELFSATITALQNVESDTQRTYIAGQLLGRGATELGALLNTSAEDTEKMRQRVHELGGVMSDEAVKAAAAYQDSLQDLKTSMSGITRGITSEFMPSFTEVMNGLTSIFAGEDGGVEKVTKGMNDILSNVDFAVGQLKPVVTKIGPVILDAVKENSPQLIKSGTKLLGDVVVSTVKNLPGILSTIGETVGAVGGTILGYLPSWVGNDVQSIANFITNAVKKINLDTLFEKISGYGEALNGYWEKLGDGFVWLTENVLSPLIEWAGNDFLPAFFDGLSAAIDLTSAALDALTPIAKNAWEYFFKPIGEFAGDVIVIGLEKIGGAIETISKTMEGVEWDGFWADILSGNFGEDWQRGWSELKDLVDDAGEAIDEFFDVDERTRKWNKFWQDVGAKIYDFVHNTLEPFIDDATDGFEELERWGGRLYDKEQEVVDFFVDGADAIKHGIEDIIDSITGLWDKYTDTFGSIGEGIFDFLHDDEGSFSIPFKLFANGGQLTNGQAVIAEAGPELLSVRNGVATVTPLSNNSRNTAVGGGVTVNVNFGGVTVAGDYDVDRMTDRAVQQLSEKLAALAVRQQRSVGGVGWNYG